MFDFFDVSVMEQLQWGLACVSRAQSESVMVDSSDAVIATSQVRIF